MTSNSRDVQFVRIEAAPEKIRLVVVDGVTINCPYPGCSSFFRKQKSFNQHVHDYHGGRFRCLKCSKEMKRCSGHVCKIICEDGPYNEQEGSVDVRLLHDGVRHDVNGYWNAAVAQSSSGHSFCSSRSNKSRKTSWNTKACEESEAAENENYHKIATVLKQLNLSHCLVNFKTLSIDDEMLKLIEPTPEPNAYLATAGVWSPGDQFKLITLVQRCFEEQPRKRLKRNDELEIAKSWLDGIGGCEDQIKEIKQLIELTLQRPMLLKSVGAKNPRGILLHGPSGTGKTLVARTIVEETGLFSAIISGPGITSSTQLHQVFAAVVENTPAIIFVDEIDLLGPSYSTQLMNFLDGLDEDVRLIVIAATNKPDGLNPAFIRVGRFEQKVHFKVPNENDRLAILRIHTRKMKLAADVHLEKIAADRTFGMTGADLALLCSQAALRYVRQNAAEQATGNEVGKLFGVSMQNIEEAAAALSEKD